MISCEGIIYMIVQFSRIELSTTFYCIDFWGSEQVTLISTVSQRECKVVKRICFAFSWSTVPSGICTTNNHFERLIKNPCFSRIFIRETKNKINSNICSENRWSTPGIKAWSWMIKTNGFSHGYPRIFHSERKRVRLHFDPCHQRLVFQINSPPG